MKKNKIEKKYILFLIVATILSSLFFIFGLVSMNGAGDGFINLCDN